MLPTTLTIKLLDIQGTQVLIDAMGCQTSTAEQILEQDGDCLFTLKNNRGKLCKADEVAFAAARKAPLRGLSFVQKQDQIEAHTYHVLMRKTSVKRLLNGQN